MKVENQQQFNLSEEDSSDIISIEELLGQNQESELDEETSDKPVDIEMLVEDKLAVEKEDEEDFEIKAEKKEEDETISSSEIKSDEDIEKQPEDIEPKVDYKSVIQAIWGDEIETLVEEGENGEEIEVLLNDVEIGDEKFINIVKSKLAEIEDTYKSRVSTEDVSDFTKHIINIEKNGGSVKEAIDLYKSYQDPLNSLDLDNESDQAKALYMRYRAQGMDDSEIKDMVEAFTIKGSIKERAFKAKEELEDAVKAKMVAMDEKAVQDQVKHEEALKQYKRDLKKSISDYNIKDSLKNKIVEIATKKDENNSYELDTLYNEFRLNPEKAAEMALYMVDRESFVKKVSEKAVTAEKKKTFKKLSLIPNKQRKTTSNTNNKSSKSDEIDLDELINN